MTALAKKVFELFGKPELSGKPEGNLHQERKAKVVELLRSAGTKEAKHRPFLPRPLGQEDAIDPWEAWTPLFDWLIEHHPDHFHAVCEAEDTLNRMEREGITTGTAYEAACRDLLKKFETARRLKLRQGFKMWMQ